MNMAYNTGTFRGALARDNVYSAPFCPVSAAVDAGSMRFVVAEVAIGS